MSIYPNTAALHKAISYGNKRKIFRILKEKDINLNATSAYNDTVLHLILKNEVYSQNDVIKLFKALLDLGIDPNIQNCSQETALRLAITRRWKDVVDLLIKNKADINTKCDGGSSIAHYFVVDENRKLSDLLPYNRAHVDELGDTYKRLEIKSAHFVEWMILKGFDFYCKNDKEISALDLAMKYNLQHIILVLLKHTKDVYLKNEQSLLHLFMENNYDCRYDYHNAGFSKRNNYIWYPAYASRYAAKIVKLLMEKEVDTLAVNFHGHTPLQAAIENQEDHNIIEMLLDDRLKVICEKDSATAAFAELLAVCAWWDKSKTQYFLEALSNLISKGADVNADDNNGTTPLYYAVAANNVDAIKLLNDHHADFSKVSRKGENLFHALAKCIDIPTSQSFDDNIKATFDLIASKGGCDVNLKNRDEKNTPLQLAARIANFTVACKLIESGAEVDSRNALSQTPLYLAAYIFVEDPKLYNLAELLLKNGANVNAKDDNGRRPLHYSASTRDSQVSNLLLKYGAYVNVYTNNTLRFSENNSFNEEWMVSKSPFLIAISNNYLKTTNEMLTYGGNINEWRVVNMIIPELKIEDGTMKKSVKIVLEHWIKLKAAGLSCCDVYEAFVNGSEYQEFYQECLKEIEKLKKSFIDTYTSIYNFLRMDFEGKRLHVSNEKLKDLVDSDNLKQRFPRYFVSILASYRQIITWRKLLEPAKRAWNELIKVDLPEECIERIFVYLTVEDLVSMVEYDYDEPNLM